MLKQLRKKEKHDVFMLLFYLLLFFGMLFCAEQTVKATLRGLSICAFTVVPSLFPFMVLSELLAHSEAALRLFEKPAALFSRLFGLPAASFFAFLFGALCGFPIGARTTSQLLDSNAITEKDASRLLLFCNNTGPAFVVAAVGSTLLKSARLGILLYFSQIASALFLGFVTRHPFTKKSMQSTPLLLEKRTLAEAVSNSAYATLKIAGFITFFTSLSLFFSQFLKNELLLCIFSSVFEVGYATFSISKAGITLFSKFFLLSFSISFAGLSVHMQTLSLFKVFPTKLRSYLAGKLIHGFLAALLTALFFPLFI